MVITVLIFSKMIKWGLSDGLLSAQLIHLFSNVAIGSRVTPISKNSGYIVNACIDDTSIYHFDQTTDLRTGPEPMKTARVR